MKLKKVRMYFYAVLIFVLFASFVTLAVAGGGEEAKEEVAEKAKIAKEIDVLSYVPRQVKALKPYVIGVPMPGAVQFFTVQIEGQDMAAKDLGVKLIYADAEWDVEKQLAQVENFCAMDVDAILFCSVDNMAAIECVKAANKAGIPFITHSGATGPDPKGRMEGIVTYIGSSEYEVGLLLGEMAEEVMGDKDAKIVLIEGTPGTAPQRQRTEAFEEVVAKHPNWEIVYKQPISGWSKEGALTMMADFLQTNQEFNLLVSHYAPMVVGAIQAMDEAGLDYSDVRIISHEATVEALELLKKGTIDLLTTLPPNVGGPGFRDPIVGWGYLNVEICVSYLNGEEIPDYIDVPNIPLNQEDAQTYVPPY